MMCFHHRSRILMWMLLFLWLWPDISPAPILRISSLLSQAEAGALRDYERAGKRFDRTYRRIKARQKDKRKLLAKKERYRKELKTLQKKAASHEKKIKEFKKDYSSIDRLTTRIFLQMESAKKKGDKKKAQELGKKLGSLYHEQERAKTERTRLQKELSKLQSAIFTLPLRSTDRKIKEAETELERLSKLLTRERDNIKRSSDRLTEADKKVFRLKRLYEADLRYLNRVNIDLSKYGTRLKKAKHELGTLRNKYIPKDKKKEIADRKKEVSRLKKKVKEIEGLVKKKTKLYDTVNQRVKRSRKEFKKAEKELG